MHRTWGEGIAQILPLRDRPAGPRPPARSTLECPLPSFRTTARHLLRAALPPPDRSDPDGIDPVLLEGLAPLMDRFCRVWYGLDVRGMHHIPAGPALLVGNHNAGSMFLEGLGTAARCYLDAPDRPWHGLAHDAIIHLPAIGPVLYRMGALRASHQSADAAFARGRKVVVFPGGNREAYRPFSRRYRVEMGDRRGFVRLALRHRVPIVPMVFAGGHSTFVVLHDGQRLARAIHAHRWLRSDTWPLWLGLPFGVFLGPGMHIPFPVKCITSILPPIRTDTYGDPADPETVERLFHTVQDAMQRELDRLAAERRAHPWPLRRGRYRSTTPTR